VEFLHPEATPSWKLPVHIQHGLHSGLQCKTVTDYWDVQYRVSFIFLSLMARIPPQELLLFLDWLMACSNKFHQPNLHVAPPKTSYHLKTGVEL
jgi:hypothetical protein